MGYELKRQAENSRHDWACYDKQGLDITDEGIVAKVIEKEGPNVVINCAAYTAVDKAESEPNKAFAINERGAANLAKACQANNAAMIHISTDYVFDGNNKVAPYTETDAARPISVYGSSKLAGEHAVAKYLDRHIILRTSSVFGPHGNNFVKTMLRLGAERDRISIVNDQLSGPTSVYGVAACCIEIAEAIQIQDVADFPWGTFHFTGSPHVSWYGFGEHIFSTAFHIGLAEKIPNLIAISSDQFPMPAKRPFDSRLRHEKLQNTFNILPDNWLDQLNITLLELRRRSKR